jgi:tetratricopeptide (TPR) repeat protein
VVGTGPGTFRAATIPYRSARSAAAEGFDRYYTDAHDLLVEYAVTTGVPGALLLASFVVISLRRSRSLEAVAALAVLAMHLVEPQNVVTTPLLFLLLGLACAEPGPLRGTTSPAERLVAVVGVAVAVAAASVLLIAEVELRTTQLDLTVAPAQQAARLLPAWPEPATAVAKASLFAYRTSGEEARFRDAVRWQTIAIERDPSNPATRSTLGSWLLGEARNAEARRAYESALAVDPYSLRALNGAARAADAMGDRPAAVRYARRSLALADQRAIRRLLDRLTA